MTVAVAVAAVAPAGPEGKHGSYVDADEESHRRETIAAVAAAAAACHHRETSVAAAVAAAAACHSRETSVAAATAAAACHRRETSVAAAAAAAEACYRRGTSVAVAATAAAEVCHHREMPYHRPFVGLRTSYTTLTCLLLLKLAALQLNPHPAWQSSPQIALASLPSGHSHPPYLKLLSLTHTPGCMPPARQDLRHAYANGIYATSV